MVRQDDCVAIFHSIHKVMQAEKLLKKEKLPVLLIPVPRQLTSDCGLAIRFSGEALGDVLGTLDQHGLVVEELYRKDEQGFVLLPPRGDGC